MNNFDYLKVLIICFFSIVFFINMFQYLHQHYLRHEARQGRAYCVLMRFRSSFYLHYQLQPINVKDTLKLIHYYHNKARRHEKPIIEIVLKKLFHDTDVGKGMPMRNNLQYHELTDESFPSNKS